jgi:hypothetical protein
MTSVISVGRDGVMGRYEADGIFFVLAFAAIVFPIFFLVLECVVLAELV